MANLGASVGGVADSFLKAYTTLNNDYRANEEAERLKAALAIQEQVQQAKLAEYTRKGLMDQAIKAKAEEVNKPFTTEFLDPTTGKTETGKYDNMYSYWEHQGKDPNEEYMKMILPVVSQHDPKLAVQIASQLIKSKTMREVAGKKGTTQQDITKPPSGFRFQGTSTPELEPIPGGPADKKDKMSDQDRAVFKGIFKNLTTAEDKAVESIPKIKQLDTMIQSLEKGDVGGFEGGLKAFAAPVAAAIGLDPNEKYGEAQSFKLMSRAFVAGMRLKLIGPGPMSDAEQKMLSQLSGGDITTSKRAARDLLQMYRDMAANDIKQYHTKYDFYKQKNPKIADAFMRFDDVVGDDSSAETQTTGKKDISTAVNFVHGAKTKEDAQKRWKQLLDPSKKWSKEELKKISDSIEYSRWK